MRTGAGWAPPGYDRGDFAMNRVTFLIDGFNLYHSILQSGKPAKWLNLNRFCRSFIHHFKTGSLRDVFYFSALAEHIEPKRPGTIKRHRDYIRCLESTGVSVELGRFKFRGGFNCSQSGHSDNRNEEKETDVAIAVRLLQLLYEDETDTAVIISGDTDLAPVVRFTKDRFKDKTVCFGFPYRRFNEELRQLSPHSFKIKARSYLSNQFEDEVDVGGGVTVRKPATW